MKSLATSSKIVLAIGDLHEPFGHQHAADFLSYLSDEIQPDVVVCTGDEIDAHALSRWPHDPDGFSAGHELVAAEKRLAPIFRLFPNVHVCESNHTMRPYRIAHESGIPRRCLRPIGDIIGAPEGWVYRHRWEIDGVLFEHGEGFSGQQAHVRVAQKNCQSTVIGHIHAHAGIQYIANPHALWFGFNIGCLIDHKKYAFAYSKILKDKPVIGAGEINKGVPRFRPMILNKGGRWKFSRVS
jgi:Calcineurin-like phosphoesterase